VERLLPEHPGCVATCPRCSPATTADGEPIVRCSGIDPYAGRTECRRGPKFGQSSPVFGSSAHSSSVPFGGIGTRAYRHALSSWPPEGGHPNSGMDRRADRVRRILWSDDKLRLVSDRVRSCEWESYPRLAQQPRYRQRGLAPWRTKLIDAKPSNNSELEQSIASESERTT
jgi:hypothetical protein